MARQIEIIANNSFAAFKDRINDFLQTHPEAKILGVHPKSLADGAGMVAVLSYTGDLVPYQTLVSNAEKSTKELLKQKDALSEALNRAGEYQKDSQAKSIELNKALGEVANLRKTLAKSDPIVDQLDEYDFEIGKIPQEWIDLYEEATGSKAIWQEKVTKGFKQYAKSNLIK